MQNLGHHSIHMDIRKWFGTAPTNDWSDMSSVTTAPDPDTQTSCSDGGNVSIPEDTDAAGADIG